MKRVLLISPLTGITGGIQKWTNHIRKYHQTNPQPDLELDFFDFSRKTNGQLLSRTPLRKLIACLSEYTTLIRHAKKTIQSSTASVVHITSPASFLLIKDLILIRCAHKVQKQVIIHFHFGRIPQLSQKKNLEWWLLSTVVKFTDHVIVLDEASLKTFYSNGYTNVSLIPNALSDDTLHLVERFGTKKNKNEILFAGHVITSKGIIELVSVCHSLKHINLKIIGAISTEMKEKLLEISGENADTWLQICGECSYEETIQAMCTASIFVLPSYTEGFPNVILESMACRCGIVATRVGAIAQMLDEDSVNACGICVVPKNIPALREAICKFLLNPDLATQYGENATLRVRQFYSMSSVYNQLCSLWKDFSKM